jgi:hypothetical protein
MSRVFGRREMCRTFLFRGVIKERDRLENLNIDGNIVLK